MVKSLCDICLLVIQGSFDKLPNIGTNIPTVYKELLIERLGFHDLFIPEYVRHIANNLFCKSLRHVNFYNCDQVDDRVLKLLGQGGCKLVTLKIHGCNSVSDTGLQCVSKGQTELVELALKKVKSLTSSSLLNVTSKKLKTVDLKGSSSISFEGVTKLAERNPSIQELYMSGIDEVVGVKARGPKALERQIVKHANLIKIAQYLGHSLEILHTELNQVDDDCLLSLATYCPNLKRLNIHGSSKITGEALTKFSMGCMALKYLDLSFCHGLSKSPSCESLWTLPTSLSEISLCGLLLADETILVECFMRLRNLKAARLCGVPALNDKTLTQIVQHAGHSLTDLDLSGCVLGCLTDDGLGAIADHCKCLTGLSLNLLNTPTCVKLLPLFQDPERAKKFTKLHLCVKSIDPDVIQQVVSSCHSLQRLDVSGLNFVTDDHLISLAENCPHLISLNLKGCQQVTDKGVCTIVRACSMVHLVLAGIHNLTDKSIFALANASNYLEEIYLNGCANISPSAVRYLVDCTIPRLFVKHVTPNARPDHLMAYNLDTGEFCRADLMAIGS